MKIVYFIDHLRMDGTQKFLIQLARGLAERGYEQAVVCLNDSWDQAVVDNLHDCNINVRIVGKLLLISGIGFLATFLWLKREQFDQAITLLFYSDVLGRSLAKLARIPKLISSIRARNVNYRKWQLWLVRKTARWVDLFVLNSDHIRNFAIDNEGVKPDQIYVIPNGVNVDEYKIADKSIVRSELNLNVYKYLIGSVGRLTDQKGYDVLIQALKSLMDDDIHLVLIGTGEEEKNLKSLAKVLGIESSVTFLGFRHDIPKLLSALDIYIQPSRYEGMPNALIEAMAAGCTVIASSIDGMQEVIQHGENGLLVEPDNTQALANTLMLALGDSAGMRRCGLSAQKTVENKYNLKNMINMWEAIFWRA